MGYSGRRRSCNVLPTVNVNGTLRHLLLTPVQLEEYQLQLQHVLTRYLQRLQWLLSGRMTSTHFTASVSTLVHGQVTIILVVSVCLSVCLFVCAEFFSAVFDPILIKLGHMLCVSV